MRSGAFNIDCRELTMDEELALASAISDSLKGRGIALLNGERIVIDSFSEGQPDEKAVESVVSAFVAHRKGHELYSVERVGDSLVVHSGDPVAAPKRRVAEKLPPNLLKLGDSLVVHSGDPVAAPQRRVAEKLPPDLLKCPFCSFVTPYEELYLVHTRSHGSR